MSTDKELPAEDRSGETNKSLNPDDHIRNARKQMEAINQKADSDLEKMSDEGESEVSQKSSGNGAQGDSGGVSEGSQDNTPADSRRIGRNQAGKHKEPGANPFGQQREQSMGSGLSPAEQTKIQKQDEETSRRKRQYNPAGDLQNGNLAQNSNPKDDSGASNKAPNKPSDDDWISKNSKGKNPSATPNSGATSPTDAASGAGATAAGLGGVAAAAANKASEAAADSDSPIAQVAAANQQATKLAENAMQVFEKIKQAGIAIKAVGSWLWTTAVAACNPVVLITMGVVIALVLISISAIATSKIVGKNENANGCLAPDSSSVSGTSVEDTGDAEKNADLMGNWFMSQKFAFLGDKPMSKNQAAAVVGNFKAESGLRFAVAEGNDPEKAKMSNAAADAWTQGGARGLGLAQWTWNPGRAGNLIKKAEELNKQWYEPGPQLELIKSELDASYGKRLLEEGFGDDKKSAGDLAIIFHDIYEGSADTADMKQRRATAANDFAKTFNPGYSGGDTGGSCLQEGGGLVTGCTFPDAGYDICGAIKQANAELGSTRALGDAMPGECIMSVKRWIEEGGKYQHIGGGAPLDHWMQFGFVEIKDWSKARPGDVVQWADAGQTWGSGVHTLMITANNGDGTYNIIESNGFAGPGTVGKEDNVHFREGGKYASHLTRGFYPHLLRAVK